MIINEILDCSFPLIVIPPSSSEVYLHILGIDLLSTNSFKHKDLY